MRRAGVSLIATAALTFAIAIAIDPATAATSSPFSPSGTGLGPPDDPIPISIPVSGVELAEQALSEVAGIVASPTDPSADSRGVAQDDASMAFRDLALNMDQLDKSSQAQAASYLSRPDTQKVTCRAICVHWSTSGQDRATSQFVKQVLSTLDHVRSRYKSGGYTDPLSDGKAGGNSKLDVYLRNIGNKGYYGYCTVDKAPKNGQRRVPAYCVLDNDFSHAEFPHQSPVNNLRVTAAHEYFHAIQYGYDYREDSWFMEATATWAEDIIYNNINDNRQYLDNSSLTDPGRSIDDPESKRPYTWRYGQWLFVRFISERFGARRGQMPKVVLEMWQLCGTQKGQPNDYSMQAIRKVLKDHGTDIRDIYADFVVANRHARTAYSEGSQGSGYPVAPATQTATLAADSRWVPSSQLDHLSSATFAAYPSKSGSVTTLDVDIAMAPSDRGSIAIIDPVGRNGRTINDRAFPMVVQLDPRGRAQVSGVPFDPRSIDHVDVNLINASTNYTCNRSTTYSCSGRPVNDSERGAVTMTARSR